MKSLRELYRIGHGPSSSHTIAPARAAQKFNSENPNASTFRVTLSGSLAATGKGHFTDKAIEKSFLPKNVEIIWKPEESINSHPNGFMLEALDSFGEVLNSKIDCSVGGGTLTSDGESPEIYHINSMAEITRYCRNKNIPLWQYVEEAEGRGIWQFLNQIWECMQQAITNGLKTEGELPGGLKLKRRAAEIKRKSTALMIGLKYQGLLGAYAYAVSEENASGGIIVTAPTCGSSGILPAVLKLAYSEHNCELEDILHSLAIAGLFGNIAKTNASISGAVAGCQAEVGVACAMASAATAELMGCSNEQIEYAAEMGLEHHLGLTCDPVMGLVQIPCIERNAHGAVRAINCAIFAFLSDGRHRISYDDVVKVLKETGDSLLPKYRETSTGGLSTVYADHETHTENFF